MNRFLSFLASLAWPAVVMIAFWQTKDELKELIGGLNTAKIGGHEFNFREISAAEADSAQANSQELRPTEMKILNTLFTKQVNKWPNYESVWTFWIGAAASDFAEYQEAKGRLLSKKLVAETEGTDHARFLTREGFEFCRQHFKDFPNDQWWPEEQIDQEKLKKVMRNELGPKRGSGSR